MSSSRYGRYGHDLVSKSNHIWKGVSNKVPPKVEGEGRRMWKDNENWKTIGPGHGELILSFFTLARTAPPNSTLITGA